MKISKIIFSAVVIMLICSGCDLASPRSDHEGTVNQSGPVIQLPLAEALTDKQLEAYKKGSDEAAEKAAAKMIPNVQTQMKTVQDSLSGFISTKVESLESLLDVSAKLENKLYADIRTELSNVMEATVEVRNNMTAHFQSDVKMQASLSAEMKALSGNVAKLDSSVQGMVDGVTGQVGVGNKMDLNKVMETLQQEFKAGRDVFTNSFPREAVDVMVAQLKYQHQNEQVNQRYQYFSIIGILVAVMAIVGFAYRNARLRENNTNKLLLEAIGQLDPDAANHICQQMKENK